MQSISWPNMFSKNITKTTKDIDATKQNLKTLLLSEQGELKDDPYFGVNLKRYMFDPNNEILKDILIDDIYTQLSLFMPQLQVERRDISIVQEDTTCFVNIRALNLSNYKTDMYNIVLFTQEEDR